MGTERGHKLSSPGAWPGLDAGARRWFQNPQKILRPYIEPGISILDYGCGPGFFTVAAARLLNGTGNLVAADLQAGMLDRLRNKIEREEPGANVRLHICGEKTTGLDEKFDLILAFYTLHEVADPEAALRELRRLLKPGGRILIAEPRGHVSKEEFRATEMVAIENGFRIVERPRIFFSRAILISE